MSFLELFVFYCDKKCDSDILLHKLHSDTAFWYFFNEFLNFALFMSLLELFIFYSDKKCDSLTLYYENCIPIRHFVIFFNEFLNSEFIYEFFLNYLFFYCDKKCESLTSYCVNCIPMRHFVIFYEFLNFEFSVWVFLNCLFPTETKNATVWQVLLWKLHSETIFLKRIFEIYYGTHINCRL